MKKAKLCIAFVFICIMTGFLFFITFMFSPILYARMVFTRDTKLLGELVDALFDLSYVGNKVFEKLTER